jgi:hypothetical protein
MDERGEVKGPANALQPALGAVQPQSQTPHALGRLMRYVEYRAMYEGDQWDARPRPGEKRLTVNYCRVFVNKAASYLMSRGVTYDARPVGSDARGEEAEKGAQQVEEYLGKVAETSSLPAVDLDTAVEAALLGDGAWTVRWDREARLPRVTQVDPKGLDARWREDDKTTLTWVRQRYWVSGAELTAEQRAALGVKSEHDQVAADEYWTRDEWRIEAGGLRLAGGPNPYGEIPYVIFPNMRVPGEFWGESDLADLLQLQKELNGRVSVFGRILEVAGNPVAVITGATDEETASLKVGPNQMWTLPEGAQADVLDLLKAGGADAHFKYIELLYRAMHDISEMPRTSFGDSSGQSQARSGVALEIELQPLLHKLARKQAVLTIALRRRAQLVLRIARHHGVKLPEVDIMVNWPPVLPQDRAALVSQEVALVNSGIHPVTRAMQMLGSTDPEPELERAIEQARRLVDIGLLGARGGQFGSSGGQSLRTDLNATSVAGEVAQ